MLLLVENNSFQLHENRLANSSLQHCFSLLMCTALLSYLKSPQDCSRVHSWTLHKSLIHLITEDVVLKIL